MSAADATEARPADGIDFVDEKQAGRVLFALFEHVAHTAGADADEHLDKIRAADAEERHVGFAGDGFRKQCLARSWRADHQHALRDASAETLKFLGVLEELDDLLDFL